MIATKTTPGSLKFIKCSVDQDLTTKCSSHDNGCRECDGSERLWRQREETKAWVFVGMAGYQSQH